MVYGVDGVAEVYVCNVPLAYVHLQGLPSMFVFVTRCFIVGKNLLDCSVMFVFFSTGN